MVVANVFEEIVRILSVLGLSSNYKLVSVLWIKTNFYIVLNAGGLDSMLDWQEIHEYFSAWLHDTHVHFTLKSDLSTFHAEHDILLTENKMFAQPCLGYNYTWAQSKYDIPSQVKLCPPEPLQNKT